VTNHTSEARLIEGDDLSARWICWWPREDSTSSP